MRDAMRRTTIGTLALMVALALAAGALAVDVQLKDGTVIHAVSYKVQGSYVLVRLENGSQVAYDLGDVNLEAMKKAEKAAQPAPETKPAAAPANAFAGAMAAGRGKATLKITDQDVSHVDTDLSAPNQKKEKKPLADHQEGGQVVVQGVKVDPAGPGKWLASGQVVNRKSQPVMDVRVLVQAVGPDSKVLGEAELPVAGTLDPGKSGKFAHTFKVEKQPLLRVRVFWMQREKTPAASGKGKGEGGEGGRSHGGYATSAAPPGVSSRPVGTNTTPSGGSRPPSLQWGGAPVYKRGGSGPPPTPLPY